MSLKAGREDARPTTVFGPAAKASAPAWTHQERSKFVTRIQGPDARILRPKSVIKRKPMPTVAVAAPRNANLARWDPSPSPTQSSAPPPDALTHGQADESNGAAASHALSEAEKSTTLASLVAAVQSRSDEDIRAFFRTGGYGSYLYTVGPGATTMPSDTAAWQAILSRAFSDESAAEALWISLRESLASQLLLQPSVVAAVQADLTHLALTSGLRPEALAALARERRALENACGEVLASMVDAYREDPACEYDILYVLCVLLEPSRVPLATTEHTERATYDLIYYSSRPRTKSFVAPHVYAVCFTASAAHHRAHPALWHTPDAANALAGCALALLQMLTMGDVSGRISGDISLAAWAQFCHDALTRDNQFSTRFAMALLRGQRECGVLFFNSPLLQRHLESRDGVWAFALEQLLLVGESGSVINLSFIAVVLGRNVRPCLVTTAELIFCAKTLYGIKGMLNTEQPAFFNAELFVRLLAIHYEMTPFTFDIAPDTSMTRIREQVEERITEETAEAFMCVPKLIAVASGLLTALQNGDLKVLELLLKMGADAFTHKPPVFLAACEQKHWPAVALTLPYGIRSTLMRNANEPLLEVKESKGERFATCSWQMTPLIALLYYKCPVAIVEDAIKLGARPNAHVSESSTQYAAWPALNFAVLHSLEAVQLLVDHEADVAPEIVHNSRLVPSPLHLACVNGLVEVARCLLDGRTGDESSNSRQKLPTLFPLLEIPPEKRTHRRELLQLLLSRGANIDSTRFSESGRRMITALSRAVDTCDVELVRDLLDHGACVTGAPLSTANLVFAYAPAGEIATVAAVMSVIMPLLAHGWTFSTSAHHGNKVTVSVLPYIGRDSRIISLQDPRLYAPMSRTLVNFRDSPIGFRRAARALAQLRTSAYLDGEVTSEEILSNYGARMWGELPLELFETVLDELFLMERAALV